MVAVFYLEISERNIYLSNLKAVFFPKYLRASRSSFARARYEVHNASCLSTVEALVDDTLGETEKFGVFR